MEELSNLIKSLNDEEKKKLCSELSSVETVEGIVDIANKFNIKISKELAQQVYNEMNNAENLSKEELQMVAGGEKLSYYFFCSEL